MLGRFLTYTFVCASGGSTAHGGDYTRHKKLSTFFFSNLRKGVSSTQITLLESITYGQSTDPLLAAVCIALNTLHLFRCKLCAFNGLLNTQSWPLRA